MSWTSNHLHHPWHCPPHRRHPPACTLSAKPTNSTYFWHRNAFKCSLVNFDSITHSCFLIQLFHGIHRCPSTTHPSLCIWQRPSFAVAGRNLSLRLWDPLLNFCHRFGSGSNGDLEMVTFSWLWFLMALHLAVSRFYCVYFHLLLFGCLFI